MRRVTGRVLQGFGCAAAALTWLAGPAAGTAHAMPGGAGGGGGAGCLPILLFLFTALGVLITWAWLTMRALGGAFTKGPNRKRWRVVFALCVLSAVVLGVLWGIRRH